MGWLCTPGSEFCSLEEDVCVDGHGHFGKTLRSQRPSGRRLFCWSKDAQAASLLLFTMNAGTLGFKDRERRICEASWGVALDLD